jgi:hypothetical protein
MLEMGRYSTSAKARSKSGGSEVSEPQHCMRSSCERFRTRESPRRWSLRGASWIARIGYIRRSYDATRHISLRNHDQFVATVDHPRDPIPLV